MTLAVGDCVTFESLTGLTRTGYVAAVHDTQVRVMDVLESLEGGHWAWSEWVWLPAIREIDPLPSKEPS